MPFYPCLPGNMLKNLPNDRTTLFRLSNYSKAKQPKCKEKSQSVFLSYIWRNAATCLPVPSPSLPIPQWLVYWNLVYLAHHTSQALTLRFCAHATSNHAARQLNGGTVNYNLRYFYMLILLSVTKKISWLKIIFIRNKLLMWPQVNTVYLCKFSDT